MAENLVIEGNTREERYGVLVPQIAEMLRYEDDMIACMANVSAMISETFGFWWTGFYRVVGDRLVLGPFQGPLACTRIAFGKGVCGTAWKERKTLIVPDVDQFPGHIACSSASKSEIVVPIISGGEVVAVLDIDSRNLDDFSNTDAQHLETIAALLADKA